MSPTPDRRTLLGAVGGLAGIPEILAAPNTRLVVGVMGMGGRGTTLARTFTALPNTEVAYECDGDASRVEQAVDAAAKNRRPRPWTGSAAGTALPAPRLR
jgi:hypothetical protein